MTHNKYGKSAIKAVEHLVRIPTVLPSEAWDKATSGLFGKNSSSQKKQCPKNTFLAICETGKIKGIKPGNYTKSIKNKFYALEAIKLLENNKDISEDKLMLWNLIPECSTKAHNSQMDVVLALWNSEFFIKS